MRVHLLALPNVQTTKDYDLDGFCTITMRFAEVLKRLGAHVTLYAGEENEAPCDELVTVVTKAEQLNAMKRPEGGYYEYQHARIEPDNPLWQLVNPRMVAEIGKRKQPRDYICLVGGGSQQLVTNAHPELMTVEYSIGYIGNYSKYRVFQSQAWRHHCYGLQHITDVRHYDAVIPGFFNEDAFPFYPNAEDRGDYLLYVGRFISKKGIAIVNEVGQRTGLPIKWVGHLHPASADPSKLMTCGEVVPGPVHDPVRNELMARARALICPTCYIEPYGCISPEAQLCGTPVISTDCGGFTETVINGVTGYRCTILREYLAAVDAVTQLDRQTIRTIARQRFGMDAAVREYGAYFSRLETLWEQGWYTV